MRIDRDIGSAIALLPDGHAFVTGGAGGLPEARSVSFDTTVRQWDLETGKELHRFDGHTSAIRQVAVSLDGRFAASASGDGTVRIWRLAR